MPVKEKEVFWEGNLEEGTCEICGERHLVASFQGPFHQKTVTACVSCFEAFARILGIKKVCFVVESDGEERG